MKGNPTFMTTHFVGVLPPEELSKTLQGCRDWMKGRYGCRSGQTTPVHITLIPPFQAAKGVDDQYLLDLLSYAITPMVEEGKLPFNAEVKGFGFFGERTLFAHVEKNPLWTELRNAIQEEYLRNRVGDLKKDNKPLVPHLTIANRDIPPGAVPSTLQHFQELRLEEHFHTDTLCLFRKVGYRWEIESRNLILLDK